MTLFIDCDDTLVLWDNSITHHDAAGPLYHGDAYEPNEALITAVTEWHLDHPGEAIVIWSGGGDDYASLWHRRMLPELTVLVLAKNIMWPKPGDICVDDQPIVTQGRTITWQTFVEEMADGTLAGV